MNKAKIAPVKSLHLKNMKCSVLIHLFWKCCFGSSSDGEI